MNVERSEIAFGKTPIPYVIQRGRRTKTVSLAIDPAEGLVVRAPAGTDVRKLDAIVASKAQWVLERLRRRSDLPPPPTARELVSGETFLYAGRQHRLRVVAGAGSTAGVTLDHGALIVRVPRGPAEERASEVRTQLVAWYRQRAEDRLPKLVSTWSERTNLAPAGVRIVEQRTRWGSCSPSGVVRLNWRIVQASTRLVEYVVLHELVHLAHAEHGTRFWRALGAAMPDFEDRRARLRAVGPRLVW